jgi:hypothetical protein
MSEVRSFFEKGRLAEAEYWASRILALLTQVIVFMSRITE